MSIFKDWFFSNIPDEYSHEFQYEILKDNLSRIKTYSITFLTLQLFVLFIDWHNYSSGLWISNSGYLYMFYAHAVLSSAFLLYSLILFTRRRKNNPPGSYVFFVWVFLFQIMFWAASQAIVEQYFSHLITAFIIGSILLGIALFMTTLTSIVVYLSSYLALVGGLYYAEFNYITFQSHIINSAAMVLLSFIISRIIYFQRISVFLNQKNLEKEINEKETAELSLQKLNQNLENIIKERTTVLLETNEKLNSEISERKNLEEKLTKEKNFLNNIIELNPYAISIFDNKGFFLRGNQALKQLFCFTPSNDYNFLTDPINIYESQHLFDRILSGHTVLFPENIYNPVKINSELPDINLYIKTIMFSIKNQDQEIDFFVQIHENVTEKRQAEIALMNSEEKFRNIFENTVEGIFQSTVEGQHISVNPSLAKMYGYDTPEKLINEMGNISTQLYVDKEQRAKLKYLLHKNGFVNSFESQIYQKDKNIIWISENVRTVKDNDGNIKYYEGTVKNITARKLAEEALMQSEENYRELITNISDIVFKQDMNGNISYISPLIEKLTGIKDSEFIGRPFIDFVNPDDLSIVLSHYSSTLSGAISPVEFRIKTKNNVIKYVRISSKLQIRDNKPESIFGIMSDITEQKLTDKNLVILEKAIKQSIDGIAIADMNGHFEFMNQAWAKMHGYEADELIGKKLNQCHTPEQLINDVIPFNQIVFKNGSYEGEVGHVRKDGIQFPTWMTTTLLKNEKGQPIGLIGIARDITEIKLSQEALKENEKKYKLLFENAPLGILSMDLNGKIIEINSALLNILGSPSPEITRQINILTFPNLVTSGISDKIKECIRDQKSVASQHFYISKWGKEIYLNIILKPIFDENNNLTGVQAIVTDITKEKEINLKLKESELKYRKIIETANEGICILDAENTIVFTNKRFVDILDLNEQELNGKSIYDLKFQEDWLKKINPQNIFFPKLTFDVKFKKKNNSELCCLLSSSPIINEDNNYSGAVILITDITDRKTMEIELLKSKEKAENSEKLTNTFLAKISYDLRITINSIIGFSHLLKQPKLSDNKKEFISVSIYDCSKTLLEKINDIIDISQINAKIIQFNFETISLNILLDEIYSDLSEHPELIQKNLKLLRIPSSENTENTIYSDRIRLKLVITKLIENAIKFTHFGQIEFGFLQQANNLILFNVTDTGVGIPAANQKFLFDNTIFHQATLQKNENTHGLGLLICKGLIENLGGHIWFESEEGRGSKFYFSLPVNNSKIR